MQNLPLLDMIRLLFLSSDPLLRRGRGRRVGWNHRSKQQGCLYAPPQSNILLPLASAMIQITNLSYREQFFPAAAAKWDKTAIWLLSNHGQGFVSTVRTRWRLFNGQNWCLITESANQPLSVLTDALLYSKNIKVYLIWHTCKSVETLIRSELMGYMGISDNSQLSFMIPPWHYAATLPPVWSPYTAVSHYVCIIKL